MPVATHPSPPSRPLEKARALWAEGRADLAIAQCRVAIDANPDDFWAWRYLGEMSRASGHHDVAAALLRRALQVDATDADTWCQLGDSLRVSGVLDESVEAFARAAHLNPGSVAILFELGQVQFALHWYEDSAKTVRRAIHLDARSGALRAALGRCLLAVGQHDKALEALKAAVRLEPGFLPAWEGVEIALLIDRRDEELAALARAHLPAAPATLEPALTLSRLLFECGHFDAAIAAGRQALQVDPDCAPAQRLVSASLASAGRIADALAFVASLPDSAGGAATLRAGLAAELGDGRGTTALAALRRQALEAPDRAEAQLAFAAALEGVGRALEAQGWIRSAARRAPVVPSAAADRRRLSHLHAELGAALLRSNQLARGVGAFRMSVRMDETNPRAHHDFAASLLQARMAFRYVPRLQNETPLYVGEYRRAAALEPGLLQCHVDALVNGCEVADWGRWEEQVAAIGRLAPSAANTAAQLPLNMLPLSPAQLLGHARAFAATIAARAGEPSPPAAPRTRRAPGPIRVGLLSNDLFLHAVATLLVEVLEIHDRRRLSIFAYSWAVPDGGPLCARVQASGITLRDIAAMSDAEAAALIRADELDVLIDLKGYTTGARTGIVVRRPAPLMASWIGYPGTMGADFIDYVLADDYVLPRGAEADFAEKVVRLPGCFLPNDRKREVEPPLPRQAYGLPERGFVFCYFGQVLKISPPVFDDWMKILLDVPGSVLWIAAPRNPTRRKLAAAAAARGVAPERLVFADLVSRMPAHLARYRAADLALDTFPYGSHSTCSDALWAGCPLLTRVGASFASRVAGSMLQAAGLPELAVDGSERYCATAIALATDAARLDELRNRLRSGRDRCALFDTPRFVAGLQEALEAMVAGHAASMPSPIIEA